MCQKEEDQRIPSSSLKAQPALNPNALNPFESLCSWVVEHSRMGVVEHLHWLRVVGHWTAVERSKVGEAAHAVPHVEDAEPVKFEPTVLVQCLQGVVNHLLGVAESVLAKVPGLVGMQQARKKKKHTHRTNRWWTDDMVYGGDPRSSLQDSTCAYQKSDLYLTPRNTHLLQGARPVLLYAAFLPTMVYVGARQLKRALRDQQ